MICREHSFNNGLIMRAVGERMVIAPPLVLTHAEAEEIMDKVHRTLDMTLGSLKANGLVA
jgi:putrescine aminotransferase